ncbi:MAG: DUF1801 domain-containing protein [Bacteroidetes bacterium]|nr:DUF1801 domain-containing protein [Bacteroidota bacterium]
MAVSSKKKNPSRAVRFSTVDEYISSFEGRTKLLLEELRTVIRMAAPKTEELISYNMPAIKQHSVLVYYAGYEKHIGFYPTGGPVQVFKNELTKYKTSKGAIQFSLDKPIPKLLVKKIVKYRISEDAEKADRKKKKS